MNLLLLVKLGKSRSYKAKDPSKKKNARLKYHLLFTEAASEELRALYKSNLTSARCGAMQETENDHYPH